MAERKLLFSITKKDLEVTYFSGRGPGGQNRNKNQNCCRIRHPASGALVTGQNHKSRSRNTKDALHRLVAHPKFKVWHVGAVADARAKKSIDELVEEAMRPGNIKVEVRNEDDTKWVEGNLSDESM